MPDGYVPPEMYVIHISIEPTSDPYIVWMFEMCGIPQIHDSFEFHGAGTYKVSEYARR